MKRHIDLSMFVQFALAARTCSEEGGVQRTREFLFYAGFYDQLVG